MQLTQKHIISLFFLIALVSLLPIAIFLVGKRQDIRPRALSGYADFKLSVDTQNAQTGQVVNVLSSLALTQPNLRVSGADVVILYEKDKFDVISVKPVTTKDDPAAAFTDSVIAVADGSFDAKFNFLRVAVTSNKPTNQLAGGIVQLAKIAFRAGSDGQGIIKYPDDNKYLQVVGVVYALTGTPAPSFTPGPTGGNITPTMALFPTPTIDPGLAGYWKFDEETGNTVADSSGKGNNGTWNGTGSYWADGKIGKAGNFNGVDNYVRLKALTGSSVDIDTNPVSISVWINTNSVTSQKAILFRGTSDGIGAGGEGYGVWVNSNGKINAGSAAGGNFDSVDTISANTWYHIVAITNGTNSKIYINGIDKTPTGVNISIVPSNKDLIIGAARNKSDTAFGKFFSGKIDNVRIYNYALSPQQVIENMR